MIDDLLSEQLAYYQASAQEYDKSIQGIGSPGQALSGYDETNEERLQSMEALQRLASLGDVLELACGTGIWTQELVPISYSLTAIDGSTETIQVNKAKAGEVGVEYECVDLFTRKPIHNRRLPDAGKRFAFGALMH